MTWNPFRRREAVSPVSPRCKLCLEELEDRVVPSFHLWTIDQVFSSADGKVQFVEMHDNSPDEELLAGHTISSQTKQFTFPSNLPSNQTANRHFLIGTTSYANLLGAVTPDYIVPDNFFSVAGDTINYAGVNTFTFAAGQLPTDGIHALSINGATVTTISNFETDFAGQSGSVSASPPGFSYDANTKTLTITGVKFNMSQATTADASGTHTTYSFTMDGTTQTFTDTQLTQVIANGQGASAAAVLVTSDTYMGTDAKTHETSEIVVLGANSGQVQKLAGNATVFMQLNNFPTSYGYVGRADSGQIHAAVGAENIFVTAGSYSYVTGVNQFHLISGAPNVYGYSANSSDQAWHYDTASTDSFVSSGSAFSYMSGMDGNQSFFNVAVAFGVNYGIATHGQSYAYMIDTPGNDSFVGNAPYSYLSGPGAFNVAEGFLLVFAQSFQGGTDFAYNHDPSHNVLGGKWILLS